MPLLAAARHRLVGGHDDALDAGRVVDGLERDDHLDGGAVGRGDDALVRREVAGLTSGTTRGTAGSSRKALDLSMTVAPAATACGTNSVLTEPPAAKKARSTPSNEPAAELLHLQLGRRGTADCGLASGSWQAGAARRPGSRALRGCRVRCRRRRRWRRRWRRCSSLPAIGRAPVGLVVAHAAVVEPKTVCRALTASSTRSLRDDRRDLDRRRADHVEVDAEVGEGAEHLAPPRRGWCSCRRR